MLPPACFFSERLEEQLSGGVLWNRWEISGKKNLKGIYIKQGALRLKIGTYDYQDLVELLPAENLE